MSENSTFKVPLRMTAHREAQKLRRQQINPKIAKQIHLNILAVYAVNDYCQWLGIETDLTASDSLNPLMSSLLNTADLSLPNLGKLECIPVLSDSHNIKISPLTWENRLGYIVVKLNSSLTEATILGFIKPTRREEIPLNQLEDMSTFFQQIETMENWQQLSKDAEENLLQFWANLAQKELHWFQNWQKTLHRENNLIKWFDGGQLNVSYNCIDRHLTTQRRNKAALIWQGSKGEERTFTYSQLHREVCKFANVLKHLGIKKGDTVGIYLPIIPEAIIAMLACARIGAIHIVIMSGFSEEILKNRLNDVQAKLVITTDGGFSHNKSVNFKEKVDLAIKDVVTVKKVLVIQRTSENITMIPDRDYWWHNLQKDASDECLPEIMNSDDVLFILHTSGTTMKSKEIVHTTGGYSLYAHITAKWVFDFQENDIYWCTADIGWITGHSYVVYGPLSNGVTTFICEDSSETETIFKAIAKHGINIFYTTPAVINNLSQIGAELPKNINLFSLRLLGSVGESLNPSLWEWYYHVMGGDRCPIVDTWWQTETGGIMIAPKPGITSLLPGCCTLPLPGIMADVNANNELIIKQPWPGMMRNLQLDHKAYCYLTGDSAYRDESGNIWISGRIDDVIRIGEIRLTSMEIESVLISHLAVKEAAVISKSQGVNQPEIWAFVVLNDDYDSHAKTLKEELKNLVIQKIGKFACPNEICFTSNLPKTKVGKIVRRFLRLIVNNEDIFADVSILENANVLEKVRNDYRYSLTSKV